MAKDLLAANVKRSDWLRATTDKDFTAETVKPNERLNKDRLLNVLTVAKPNETGKDVALVASMTCTKPTGKACDCVFSGVLARFKVKEKAWLAGLVMIFESGKLKAKLCTILTSPGLAVDTMKLKVNSCVVRFENVRAETNENTSGCGTALVTALVGVKLNEIFVREDLVETRVETVPKAKVWDGIRAGVFDSEKLKANAWTELIVRTPASVADALKLNVTPSDTRFVVVLVASVPTVSD